jgi:hypothetical protein
MLCSELFKDADFLIFIFLQILKGLCWRDQEQIVMNKSKRYRLKQHHILKHLQLSQLPTRLIPIRLDLEFDGIKLRDQFTWNLNETMITPEEFAAIMVNDLVLIKEFIPLIVEQIRSQSQVYSMYLEEEFVDDGSSAEFIACTRDLPLESDNAQLEKGSKNTRLGTEENVENTLVSVDSDLNDVRVVINLDIHVGSLYLKDQFEWPLFSHTVTPEEFTTILCNDIGVSGEFIPTIAHSIREQLVLARLNFDEANVTKELIVYREEDESDWEPSVKFLNEEEKEQMLKEDDRNYRFLYSHADECDDSDNSMW